MQETKLMDESELNSNLDRSKLEKDVNELLHSPASFIKISKTEKVSSNNNSSPSIVHMNSHFRRENSARSLKNYYLINEINQTKLTSGDLGSYNTKYYSDAISIKSWASVGMGSTDGKKMIVRRIPTSTVELFNIVNPPT